METTSFSFFWDAINRQGEFYKDEDNNLQVTILDPYVIEEYFPKITFRWNEIWGEYELPNGIPDHADIAVSIYNAVLRKAGQRLTVTKQNIPAR